GRAPRWSEHQVSVPQRQAVIPELRPNSQDGPSLFPIYPEERTPISLRMMRLQGEGNGRLSVQHRDSSRDSWSAAVPPANSAVEASASNSYRLLDQVAILH